jgi:hypothetical protein
MKAWAKIVGVNLLGLLTLLVVVELSIRVVFPEIIPRGTDRRLFADSIYGDAPGLQVGGSGLSDGQEFEVDEDGFWRYADVRADSLPAWLFLGDSVTMGIGVPPDSTFAGRIAAAIDTVRLLNPSMIGYAARHYEDVTQALSGAVPSLRRVVLFWCLNDVYDASLADPGQALRSAVAPILTFLRRHVRTYEWIKAVAADRPRVYYSHDAALYVRGLPESSVRELKAIAAGAEAAGARLDVVVMPYEYQVRRMGEDSVLGPQRAVAAVGDSLGISVHDPSHFLTAQNAESSDLYLFGDGIHLSNRGHRLLAEYLVSEVL